MAYHTSRCNGSFLLKALELLSQLVKKISLRRCTSLVLALCFREEIVLFELAEFALALTKKNKNKNKNASLGDFEFRG